MSDVDEDGDEEMTHSQNSDAERRIMQCVESVGEKIVASLRDSTSTINACLTEGLHGMRSGLQNVRIPIDPQLEGSGLPPLLPHRDNPATLQQKSGSDRLPESLNELQAICNSLTEEVRKRDSLLLKSRAEIKQLNTIIIKHGANAGPSDDEINSEFCSIRNSIFKIAKDHYQADTVFLQHSNSNKPHVWTRQYNWLRHWGQDPQDLRNCCVQGAIFEVLNDLLFSKPVFGMEDKVDDQLKKFEDSMEHCREILQKDRIEWRRRTVTCAKSLNSPAEVIGRAVSKIKETLQPALTTPYQRQTSRAKSDQLEREVLAVVKKSLHLALVLRESKDIFKVIVPEGGVVVDEMAMELVAMEKNKQSSPRTKVAYTVFGGLEKTTLHPGGSEDIVVLEKAWFVGFDSLASR